MGRMKRYMLDMNMVSYLFKEHSKVVEHLTSKPVAAICISAITEAELLYGLAKRPDAKRLHAVVNEFLKRVDVLPWDSQIAARYGAVRARIEKRGNVLAPLDLLIGTHALDTHAVLVTNDKAFQTLPGLSIEDWTI
jgi:tRNA(fMet)-specific endonuclease VapC